MTVTIDSDTFTRANQVGWGTASGGSVWSRKSGTATWDITSNQGRQDTTAGTNSYQLGTNVSVSDAEALVRVSASSTSDSIAVTLRVQGTTTYYFLNITGTTLAIKKDVSAAVTQLQSATVTFTANPDFYWIRFRVIGTNLYGRFWKDGTGEPTTWTVTVSDSSLTGAGGYGLRALTNTAGDIITFDSYTVYQGYTMTGQGNAKFATTMPLNGRTEAKFSTRMPLNSRARANFLTAMKLNAQGSAKFSTRFPLNARTRAKFTTAMALRVVARGKFLTAMRLVSSVRSRFSTRFPLNGRTRAHFSTRMTLAGQGSAKFSTRIKLMVSAQSTFMAVWTLSAAARVIFPVLRIARTFTSVFLPQDAYIATFQDNAMPSPYSTVQVSTAVTDNFGVNQTALASVSVVVLFPDGTTQTFGIGNGVVNRGGGLYPYQLTYESKGPGLHRETWTFVGEDGTNLTKKNITAISY